MWLAPPPPSPARCRCCLESVPPATLPRSSPKTAGTRAGALGEFDALFIGGTTAWKLGPAAADLAAQARARGLRVHLGRDDSLKRLRHAASIGCHSVDGTHLAYGPNRILPELLTWLKRSNRPMD